MPDEFSLQVWEASLEQLRGLEIWPWQKAQSTATTPPSRFRASGLVWCWCHTGGTELAFVVCLSAFGCHSADGAGKLALTPFLMRCRPGETLVCFLFTAQMKRICLLPRPKCRGKQVKNLERKKPFPLGFKAAARQTSSTQKAQLISSVEKQQSGNGSLQGCSSWPCFVIFWSENLVKW